MKKELKNELDELKKDKELWKTTVTAIPLPAIISFILSINGKPQVLKVGLYIYAFSFIVLTAKYILTAKKTLTTNDFLSGTSESKIVDKYPSLHRYTWGVVGFSVVLTLLFVFVPPVNSTVVQLINGTPTATASVTPLPTSTFTPTFTSLPSPTPTTLSDATYILVVLDASAAMQEPFDTQTKWDAALRSVRGIMDGLDPLARYGLVVIGGEPAQSGDDPCREPSNLKVPFGNRAAVSSAIDQLQPAGGGSLYTAFILANNQFRSLPSGANGTMIYITGSSDICDQDEWAALKKFLQIPGAGGVVAQLFSEIIMIDNDQALTRTIQDQLEAVSLNLNVQAPPSIFYITQINNTVINHFDERIAIIATNLPTIAPTLPLLSTATSSPTPLPGVPPVIPPLPTNTNIPPTNTPTFTRTFTPTFTKSVTPSFTPWPNIVNITIPGNGTNFGCPDGQECVKSVTVQWMPETQAAAQGLYLSIWVKPYPGDDNYLYYSQSPLVYVGDGIWQSTQVYLGGAGDPTGTPFTIYAIVTNQPYGTGIQTSPLPTHSQETLIGVTR